jgi:hypothetical protein
MRAIILPGIALLANCTPDRAEPDTATAPAADVVSTQGDEAEPTLRAWAILASMRINLVAMDAGLHVNARMTPS